MFELFLGVALVFVAFTVLFLFDWALSGDSIHHNMKRWGSYWYPEEQNDAGEVADRDEEERQETFTLSEEGPRDEHMGDLREEWEHLEEEWPQMPRGEYLTEHVWHYCDTITAPDTPVRMRTDPLPEHQIVLEQNELGEYRTRRLSTVLNER